MMISSNLLTYIKRVPLWVYLLLLGIITFYTYEIRIASDMGWYMNSALNVFMGKGYTNMDGSLILNRGLMFPMMIAGSYWLLGASPWNAFWVVRMLCILNPIIIFFLGKKLYGKWVGFSAALLILTSYSMNYWSYRHLDAVWPFFTISSVLTIYLALENKRYVFFILSGIFMGIAYLVKEAPILLFPFPFLIIALISAYRNKTNLTGAILYAIAIMIMILPWVYYVYSQTHSMKWALLGAGRKIVSESTIDPNLLCFVKNYVVGLWDYYNGGSQSLSLNFSLAPLFVCAWIFTIYRAIRGEKASVLLTVCLFLLSPYLSHVGRSNFRVGQLIIFFLLTYLVTARFCLDLFRKMFGFAHEKFRVGESALSYWSVFLILSLIFIQTFVPYKRDKGNREFLKGTYLYHSLFNGKGSYKVLGNFGESSKECGEWIKSNIPSGSRIMYFNGKAIYFYSGGQYSLFSMPIISSMRVREAKARKTNNNIIFMSSWIGGNDPRNSIFLLTECDLFSKIKERKIKYIIITRRRNYLSLYFDKNESFLKVKEFANGAIKVYKVLDRKPVQDFRPLITIRLATYLKILKNENHDKFEWYVRNFFRPILGWNYKDVEKLTHLTKKNKLDGFTVVKKGRLYRSSLDTRMYHVMK